jgi:hypothetical protein
VTPIALHLRPGVREVFTDWLGESRPELLDGYAALYGRGSYLPAGERRRLDALVRPDGPRRERAARFERRQPLAPPEEPVALRDHEQRSLF